MVLVKTLLSVNVCVTGIWIPLWSMVTNTDISLGGRLFVEIFGKGNCGYNLLFLMYIVMKKN